MRAFVSLLLLLTTAAAARPSPAAVILPDLVGKLGASSEAIDCARAGDHLRIESDAHLDPSCVWTGGVEILASDVVFDCRGATIADPEGNDSRGIVVRAPTDVELSRIEVRNCVVRGFLNNFRVERIGFRDLAPGQEYDNGFSRVLFRNNRLFASRGSGVFINAYVEGVTLRDLEISDSGSVGIYLEAGSRGTRVLDNHIHDNGYGDVDPVNGIPFVLDGLEFRYLSTGREGIAIDGSRHNEVRGNLIERNSYGGIFLYKNCGEYVTERPAQWWERRYGADDNLIRGNVIRDEDIGVWVGSRMNENQIFLDCSDSSYQDGPIQRIHLDYAARNAIKYNTFVNVPFGIRIEDDGTRIERNRFESDDRSHQAVLIGTRLRAERLGRPVADTIVRGNRAFLGRNPTPYVAIHPHLRTLFRGNRRDGALVGLADGDPPTTNFHLFVRDIWLAP